MNKYILVGAILIGLPAVAFGGSFTTSLLQGKSPSEAITIVGEQLDTLFGKVETIESQQQEINQRLNSLEEQQQEQVPDKPSVQSEQDEPQTHPEPQRYSLDTNTQEICDEALLRDRPSEESLIGDIQDLCDQATTTAYPTREHFEQVVSAINEKWQMWLEVESAQAR